jgi:hypothetical protein
MFRILILPVFGVVFILLLRSHKEKETIQIFKYEQRETICNGDSITYIKECWETENNERKNGKVFDSNRSDL